MPLLPIKEDFQQRTLANIPGYLGKLAYVADLREGDRYVHWGIPRVYGEEATQRVLGEIHRALFLQVLRTPLQRVVEDFPGSAAGRQMDTEEFLDLLKRNSTSMVPLNTGGGSAAHFNSVIAALFLLCQKQ